MAKPDFIYVDGAMVPYAEATIHVASAAAKYGANVFEGICAYEGDSGRSFVFRLREHLVRLHNSVRMMQIECDYGDAAFWRQRAAVRKQAMLALMWDDQRGYFFDYDFANHRRSTYISATGLCPLWAKMLDANNPKEMEDVRRSVAFAAEKLEQLAGLSATAKESVASARRHDARQWDYPYGWAPHQMLAWRGLRPDCWPAKSRRRGFKSVRAGRLS